MLEQRERSLEETEIHDVLSNDRRWRVLECFVDEGEDEVTLRELANRIARLETGEDPPPRSARQSVYVTLHQSHLPKLDRLGIVEYDDVSKRIELGRRARELEQYLDMGGGEPRSWLVGGVAVTVLGALLTVASTFGAPWVATYPPAAYATVAFALILGGFGYRLTRTN